MRTHRHPAGWGTPISTGSARNAQGWYEAIKAWWATYKAMRREAKLATIAARWDAQPETIGRLRTEAAPEMAAAQEATSVAAMFYGLSQ